MQPGDLRLERSARVRPRSFSSTNSEDLRYKPTIHCSDEHRLVMRLDQLKSYALSFPHTTVVKQWGECLVFKVAGKMFLLVALDAEIVEGVVFKCTPEEFDELTAIDGVTQAPYCAKRHWVRAGDLDAVP